MRGWVFYKAGVGGGSFYFTFSRPFKKVYFVYTCFDYFYDNLLLRLCASVPGFIYDALLLSIEGNITLEVLLTECRFLSDCFLLFILIIDNKLKIRM